MAALSASATTVAPSARPTLPHVTRPPGEPLRRARGQRLAQAIEAAIVPRLLLARPPASMAASADASDVAVLADLALRDDDSALAFVATRHAAGLPLEAVYLDLLAPTARQLGEQWENDSADFTQVTIGVWRLQRMLRELSAPARQERKRDDRRRILLAPVPGERHVFAVALLAELFRQAGWEVEAPLDASAEDLARLVARGRHTLLGLSLAGEDSLDAVPALIRGLRRAGAAGVMVGGPVFRAHPDYVTLVGADATAVDGRQAIIQAETLLGLVANRSA